MKQYDVIIVGGGITGACTARDCALRGLKTLLLEREDLSAGTSGRNHGLLHSGARYAVTDPEGARECINENRILKRIATNCVESTGGLFISLPEDSLTYQAQFVQKCNECGIDAQIISPRQALQLAPAINPTIIGAVKVPDAGVDPFRLSDANALDATRRGADVLKFAAVTGFIKEGTAIVGVRTEKEDYYAPITVLAAGIWAAQLAQKAGAHIEMLPSKGSLLVFGHRVTDLVINRCRKPSNADILVPDDVVSVLGTTSTKVPFEECDNISVTREEVDYLLSEGVKMVPSLASTRIIRAYAGVRPLVVAEEDAFGQKADGRSTSRGIVLLSHEERDGIPGLITITGGKLTTARLMAERVTDLVCAKLGKITPCITAETPLPGSEKGRNFFALSQTVPASPDDPDVTDAKRTPTSRALSSSDPTGVNAITTKTIHPATRALSSTDPAVTAAIHRHGSEVAKMNFSGEGAELVCECEQVSRAEIGYCIKHFGVRNLLDLRRHTRIGMGTCQGSHCIRRAAELLAAELGTPQKATELEREYLRERWKGMVPIMWGETLREAEFMRGKYTKETSQD